MIHEKLTFLLEKLENGVISLEQFQVLLDKDMQSVKSLTSILEDSTILEKDSLFLELLNCSRASFVVSILEQYPIYKRDFNRRNFLLQNINQYYIGDLVPILNYDVIFENPIFLNKLIEKAKTMSYTYYNLFESIRQVFSSNYEYLSLECANPFIEKACSLSNFSNLPNLLHSLEIPALRNLEFFHYLYNYYDKNGKFDFYDLFHLLEENLKLELVLQKVSSISSLDIEEEKDIYFSRLLNHLSYLSTLDGDSFDFCLRHIFVNDEDFSYIPSFVSVSFDDDVYLKILTFPSTVKKTLFDSLSTSFSSFIDLKFLEQLSTYSISDMKVMLMKFAIDNRCLDYILSERNSFKENSSFDISGLSMEELVSLKNKIGDGCFLFDGKTFTFTLLESDFPYLISDNFLLPKDNKEKLDDKNTKIKKKKLLNRIFKI